MWPWKCWISRAGGLKNVSRTPRFVLVPFLISTNCRPSLFSHVRRWACRMRFPAKMPSTRKLRVASIFSRSCWRGRGRTPASVDRKRARMRRETRRSFGWWRGKGRRRNWRGDKHSDPPQEQEAKLLRLLKILSFWDGIWCTPRKCKNVGSRFVGNASLKKHEARRQNRRKKKEGKGRGTGRRRDFRFREPNVKRTRTKDNCSEGWVPDISICPTTRLTFTCAPF